MKIKKVILILIILIVTYNSKEIINMKTEKQQNNTMSYLEGCIKEEKNVLFLIGEFKTELKSDTISIKDELDIGSNYKLFYDIILESNPPVINIVNYEKITKNYCEK